MKVTPELLKSRMVSPALGSEVAVQFGAVRLAGTYPLVLN